MDRESIIKCLSPKHGYQGNLRGVCAVKDFYPKRVQDGDSWVLNTNHVTGEHWFCVIFFGNTCVLFDCNLLDPIEYHNYVKRRAKKYSVCVQWAQLQSLQAFTCGEHCICFLHTIAKINPQKCDFDYGKILFKLCKKLGISCDQYVTDFIYKNKQFKGIEKPKLTDVSKWFLH